VRRLLFLVVAAGALWGSPGAFAAGWCGDGATPIDRPDAVTGPQVHAIWVSPADGGDTFGAGAQKLAADVASITAWWQGQDPTRVLRFDNAAFPAGACTDISYVRLPETGASLVGSVDLAADAIERDLRAAGIENPYKKYLVYYDGPQIESGICGVGSGGFDVGPSYAYVWLNGCTARVQSDNVAAHELLHTLGALPSGAPHACPGDDGHPCDSNADVLYPYNSGLPLASTFLDYNHDDYYGHGGSWADLQDTLWMHRLDLPQLPVAVTLVGKGIVRSDLPGVDCTATCTTQWDSGTNVALTTFPVPGTRFVGWQGACTGVAACFLETDAPRAVTATFGPNRISVKVSVAGRGRVACTPSCSSSFSAGRTLTLSAVAAKGWRFSSWAGVCKGTRPTCRPKTDYSLSARAIFKKKR
jgi:Divergent InlB B-repeat domain